MEKPQSKAKRVGIIGGSFDPVHTGHLVVAQDAMEKLELSEVVFIPAARPPHKMHVKQAEVSHRLDMLHLATEADLRFSVSDLEIQRGGISYTVDTLRELQIQRADCEWVLIVGSDTLVDLHNWYEIDELLALCEVASFMRPGECSMGELSRKIKLPDAQKEKLLCNVIDAHLIEISSTEIRMRVAEGLGIRYLVPAEVEMYIFEHGLYRI